MKRKDELKEIDIKNFTCGYFDDKMRVVGIEFDNILLDVRVVNLMIQ